LKISCFDWVAMNCTIYTVSCNFAIHVTYVLTLTMYKFSELQMSFIIQKLSCKASCKTPLFSHSEVMEECEQWRYVMIIVEFILSTLMICFKPKNKKLVLKKTICHVKVHEYFLDHILPIKVAIA
jgi:hypothetical protein